MERKVIRRNDWQVHIYRIYGMRNCPIRPAETAYLWSSSAYPLQAKRFRLAPAVQTMSAQAEVRITKATLTTPG
jgi:hypothetical protein